MAEIFINYRTGDEENVAALLESALSHRFAPEVFFRASRSIELGDDYEKALVTAVRRSVALLAVIGPRWLEVRDAEGRRKIDVETDWTRREILEAFDNRVKVIPVLVGSVRPLSAADLPAELSELAVCEYTRLRNRDMTSDLDRLAVELAKLVPGLPDLRDQPKPAAPNIVNKASGNARVGIQGNVTGNVDFGNFLTGHDGRD
jgi:hypothetical protein